jgi:hypothetical protein
VMAFCDSGYDELAARGRERRGKGRPLTYDGDRSTPSTAAPRGCCAAPLLLESAKVGSGLDLRDEDEPGFWSRTATTTVRPWLGSATGATDVAGHEPSAPSGTPRVGPRPRSRRLGRPPSGPARGRPAHGRGRLSGRAQLLDRLGARRRWRSPSSNSRTVSLSVSWARSSTVTASRSAARSAATSSGTGRETPRCCSSPAVPASCHRYR